MAVILSPEKARASEILLEIGSVLCNVSEPFTLTSGWRSPVYTDCRKLITPVAERREIIKLMVEQIESAVGSDGIDVIAGGETAGIPFAAWVAEAMSLPMIYIRKKPKAMGRMGQIEGMLEEGQRVFLVEDLTTDGKSKITFVNALREAGAVCDHCAVVFYYGAFQSAGDNLEEAGITLHALTNWPTTLEVAESKGYFTPEDVGDIRRFLENPEDWSAAHSE